MPTLAEAGSPEIIWGKGKIQLVVKTVLWRKVHPAYKDN